MFFIVLTQSLLASTMCISWDFGHFMAKFGKKNKNKNKNKNPKKTKSPFWSDPSYYVCKLKYGKIAFMLVTDFFYLKFFFIIIIITNHL